METFRRPGCEFDVVFGPRLPLTPAGVQVLEVPQSPPPPLFIHRPSSIADPGDPPLFPLPHTKPRLARSVPPPSTPTFTTYQPALFGVALIAWASILDDPIFFPDIPIPTSTPASPLMMPSFPSFAGLPSVYSHWSTLIHPSQDAVSQTCEIQSSWSDEELALNATEKDNVPYYDLYDYEGDDEGPQHSMDSGQPKLPTSQPLDTTPDHSFPVMRTPFKPLYQVATLNWASQPARSSSPALRLAPVPTVVFQTSTSPRPTPQFPESPRLPDFRDSSGSSTALGTVTSDPDTLVPSAPNPKPKTGLRKLFSIRKDPSTRSLPQASPLSQELKKKSWFSKIFSRKIEARR